MAIFTPIPLKPIEVQDLKTHVLDFLIKNKKQKFTVLEVYQEFNKNSTFEFSDGKEISGTFSDFEMDDIIDGLFFAVKEWCTKFEWDEEKKAVVYFYEKDQKEKSSAVSEKSNVDNRSETGKIIKA